MSTQIQIPRLGVGMTEGTLVEWLVSDGDTVEPGTPIYTLATDKIETEVEAVAGGTIKQMGKPDEIYQVGDVIGEIS